LGFKSTPESIWLEINILSTRVYVILRGVRTSLHAFLWWVLSPGRVQTETDYFQLRPTQMTLFIAFLEQAPRVQYLLCAACTKIPDIDRENKY